MSDHTEDSQPSIGAPVVINPLCTLLGAVTLLSTVPIVTKHIFQHSQMDPPGLALVRVSIGFVFLFAMTLVQDRRGLSALTGIDVWKLSVLGLLGVGSYVIAAWGLLLTSVTHYILIYSLLSPITAMLSVLLRRSHGGGSLGVGIGISLLGEGIALSDKLEQMQSDFGLGDLLILTFTVMMACHLVCSVSIVKRFGAVTANTVMFGTSTMVLLLATFVRTPVPSDQVSTTVMVLLLYVGVATASVFLLRYRVLRTITPATVAVYQNMTPALAILFAHTFLDEPLHISTVAGGAIILLGAELVRRAQLPGWTAPIDVARWSWRVLVAQKPSR